MNELRRKLKEMPFDKVFKTESGNKEFCHATGYEVCEGNPDNIADWWNEYKDSEGNLYYGR